MAPGEFDLVGFAVGIVDRAAKRASQERLQATIHFRRDIDIGRGGREKLVPNPDRLRVEISVPLAILTLVNCSGVERPSQEMDQMIDEQDNKI